MKIYGGFLINQKFKFFPTYIIAYSHFLNDESVTQKKKKNATFLWNFWGLLISETALCTCVCVCCFHISHISTYTMYCVH